MAYVVVIVFFLRWMYLATHVPWSTSAVYKSINPPQCSFRGSPSGMTLTDVCESLALGWFCGGLVQMFDIIRYCRSRHFAMTARPSGPYEICTRNAHCSLKMLSEFFLGVSILLLSCNSLISLVTTKKSVQQLQTIFPLKLHPTNTEPPPPQLSKKRVKRIRS